MRKSLLSYFCGCITALFSVSAFSVTVGTPTECDPLTISWTGGQAPFEILLAPINQTVLNSSVPTSAFSDGMGSYSIPQLPFVTGSQFVLTMSDATGFGSGGTTTTLTVGFSIAHNNCNTTGSPQQFYFSTSDPIQQCSQYTFSNYTGAVLPVTITGLIPGGSPFAIGGIFTYSFERVADIQGGTDIVFYMTDSRPGVGQGGVDVLKKVANSTDASCLVGQSSSPTSSAPSPSLTSSAPSQTSSQGTPSQTPLGHNTSTVGIIAGAAGGGVVLLVLLIILGLYCKRKASRSSATTSASQREARRLQRTGDGLEIIEDGQVTENFTHQTDRISLPLLTTPHRTLPFGLAAPVHPGTHSHLTDASVGNFAINDSHTSFSQMQPSPLGSNTASVHFAPSNQPRVLSHHPAASSFPAGDGTSRLSSNIDGFASHAGAGSLSMSSSGGRAAGPTASNSSAQIIRHTDMEDVRALADVQEVIELPPEYTERLFSSAEAARVTVMEPARVTVMEPPRVTVREPAPTLDEKT